MNDYRQSHINKGEDYDQIFRLRLRESRIWELEKTVLTSLVQDHFPSEEPRHLDFACGTGRVLTHLRPYVSQSVGIDVSPGMTAVASRKSPTSEVLVADLTHDAVLQGREFDLITSFRFFPNAELELRKQAIQALRPLLSPRGVVIFNNHLNSSSSVRRLQRIANRPTGHTMSHAEVDQVCDWGDLRVIEEYGLGVLPDFGERRLWSRALVKMDRKIHTRRGPVGLCENQIYVLGPSV